MDRTAPETGLSGAGTTDARDEREPEFDPYAALSAEGSPRSAEDRKQPSGARPDSLIASALGTFGTNVATAVLSLTQVLIVARTLGPSGRGTVAFLITITTLTGVIASLGIQEANANLAASHPRLRPSLATNSVIASLVLGIGAALVILGLVGVFPAVGGHVSSVLLDITLATMPMFVLKWYLGFMLQADYLFRLYNLGWLTGPLTTVITNGLFAALGILTVESAVITWLVGQALGLMVFVVAVLRRYGFGRPDLRLGRASLSFGLKTHFGRFMSLGNARADQWFIGAMLGSRQLGIYSIAVAWAETLFYIPGVVVLLQRPDLVRAEPSEAAARAAQVFRRAALISVAAGAALALAAPFLCTTVFGSRFSGSVDQLRVLAISAIGVAMLSLLSNAVIAQRRPLLASCGDGFALVVTLALDIALIPHLAGLGAAIATSVAYTVGGVGMAWIFLRALDGRVLDLVPRWDDFAWYTRKARSGLALAGLQRATG
jgi:O-antigen/teichoic acid export membrane protein